MTDGPVGGAPGAERLRERIAIALWELRSPAALRNWDTTPSWIKDYHYGQADAVLREALAAAPPAPEGPTLEEEQAAHEKIASLCFAAGAESPDGTSVGAVKDLIRRGHASAERVRQLIAKWRAYAESTFSYGSCAESRAIEGAWRMRAKEDADELERALPPSTGGKVSGATSPAKDGDAT